MRRTGIYCRFVVIRTVVCRYTAPCTDTARRVCAVQARAAAVEDANLPLTQDCNDADSADADLDVYDDISESSQPSWRRPASAASNRSTGRHLRDGMQDDSPYLTSQAKARPLSASGRPVSANRRAPPRRPSSVPAHGRSQRSNAACQTFSGGMVKGPLRALRESIASNVHSVDPMQHSSSYHANGGCALAPPLRTPPSVRPSKLDVLGHLFPDQQQLLWLDRMLSLSQMLRFGFAFPSIRSASCAYPSLTPPGCSVASMPTPLHWHRASDLCMAASPRRPSSSCAPTLPVSYC